MSQGRRIRVLEVVVVLSLTPLYTLSWTLSSTSFQTKLPQKNTNLRTTLLMSNKNKNNDDSPKAGTFFNPIPDRNNNESNDRSADDDLIDEPNQLVDDVDDPIEILRSQQNGFKSPEKRVIRTPSSPKSFIGIGPTLNDVTKPEYDEQGYTLYADEQTGMKSRVFEALIEYPCLFTMKIVGRDDVESKSTNDTAKKNANNNDSNNNERFVQDILQIVATSCKVSSQTILDNYSIRQNGKWTSITVQAPVTSAEMLYQLYEDVDRDPRVKFKF